MGADVLRVLLLNPPADSGVRQVREGRCMQRAGAWTAIWTPLSLAYCAAVLREDWFEIKLMDCIVENISFEGVEDAIGRFKPGVVIVNAVTPSIVSDLSTGDHIKNVDSSIQVAVIGIHGSALPEETLRLNNNIDFVIKNEPEIVVRNLCRAARDGSGFDCVRGISFRKNNEYVHNERESFIDDIDQLPYPAYDLIKTEKYLLPFSNKRFLLIATGRGCGHNCSFCANYIYYGRKVRLRKPQSITRELEYWKNKLGIRDFLFWSEGFTMDRDFCIDVAMGIIERKLHVNWICNSRVDDVDDEMLRTFKEAGCSMIGYGIESGNDEILKDMNKKFTTKEIRNAVSLSKKHGIEVVAHLVIGYPGETEEMIKRTVRFVKELNIEFAQFYCAVPFPGSQLYSEALRNGWICISDWKMFEQNYSVLKYGGMSPAKNHKA